MNWFANVVVRHPLTIILAVIVFSATTFVLSFFINSRAFPSFSDPQLGFSTRGTVIANRLTTWENLIESMKPSGQFIVNPKELLMQNLSSTRNHLRMKKLGTRRKPKNQYGNVIFIQEQNNLNRSTDNFALIRKKMKNSSFISTNKIIGDEGYFCGNPDVQYAHIVIKAKNNRNLLELSALMTLCSLEYELSNAQNFSDLCIQNTQTSKCCRSWSIVNYIAALNNRASCFGVTDEDVDSTVALLGRCSQYYFQLKLMPDCFERKFLCKVPKECVEHNAVYNILYFLTSANFISENNPSIDKNRLYETMLFLPLAGSTAILPYFHTVENLELSFHDMEIVAMDFGIKSSLFDEYLVHDMRLMVLGTIFIFFSVWWCTKSLFLTIGTIIEIIFSLWISYFFYVYVFKQEFFPFMNLLALIVAMGIGCDDAFIFHKIWSETKMKKEGVSMTRLMTDTFHHAFVSIFVSTVTTTVAFVASYISSVIAVCCFSIFAGTTVFVNFLLMVTWFPACVVVMETLCEVPDRISKNFYVTALQRCCYNVFTPVLDRLKNQQMISTIGKWWRSKETYLLNCIINSRYLWITLFLGIAAGSMLIVLVDPKLELPNSQDFQLFVSSHLFEQYDFIYKNHFRFHRESLNSDTNYELPLRFVWGVKPIDNGDPLDPTNLGTLELDPSFNMSDPISQMWLLKFCKNLKRQPFFRPMLGPLLPNCFIETFLKSMKRSCTDLMTSKDLTPCCQSSSFPFTPEVFDRCIIQEMADIYLTPSQFLIPGLAGPKFSKDQNPTIKVVVVEYFSNYSYSMSYDVMNEFFNRVENWMQEQLETAPEGMQRGWFVSELGFYDLQKELTSSTMISIFFSMGLALLVLLFSTRNPLVSFYAIVTITSSIFVTIAILVLMGWKLNILESVAISVAIGLAVDFSLHLSVNYTLCPVGLVKNRQAATRFALSNMTGPALMAAITTGAAGAFMLPSFILPYNQIGIILVVVMSVSWMYATFFLGSLFATVGPQNHFGQFSYSKLCQFFNGNPSRDRTSSHQSNSSISETHEMEMLTDSSLKTISLSLQKYLDEGGPSNRSKVLSDQSPSAISSITTVMAD